MKRSSAAAWLAMILISSVLLTACSQPAPVTGTPADTEHAVSLAPVPAPETPASRGWPAGPAGNTGSQGARKPPTPIPLTASAGQDAKYAVVRVYFGTDRFLISNGADALPSFEARRASSVAYGTVDVSIPRNHLVGGLESPSIWRLETEFDPARHVTTLRVNVTGYDQFVAEMRSKALNAPTPSVMLFVHGYNVSFEDAARRTAQMAYDLDFKGAPVFFSWPSHAHVYSYLADGTELERAQADLELFLAQVLAASPDADVYVIGHSMGNRGLTAALLNHIREHPGDAARLKQIILAAPDIDTDKFVNQIAPRLIAMQRPITLYVSSRDRALTASSVFNSGPRAGDSGQNLVLLDGIDTIDVTSVESDFIGHSYVGDRRSILADLYYLINGDARPAQRFGLTRHVSNGHEYWIFNP